MTEKTSPERGATWALWAGIGFSVLYTAAIYLLGGRLAELLKRLFKASYAEYRVGSGSLANLYT